MTAQGTAALGAVAGAGEQRADLLKGQAEGERRGERVGSGSEGQLCRRAYTMRDGERESSPAGEQRMMNHGEAEHPRRMDAQRSPS